MHHNNYYVYTHTRLDSNEVFYVGIGKTPPSNKVWQHRTKYSRAYAKSKRHKFWKNVINKVDYKVDIVYETSCEEQVKLKEIELISLYGRRCCDTTGTLVNFSAGGDRTDGPRNFGIKVTQKDLKTKEVIKIWPELKYIEQQLGYLKTNIVKCCRKKQRSAYGYIWEYSDNHFFDSIKPTSARKKNTNRGVGILVYNKEGQLIHTFRTQEETASYFGIHRTTLHRYLHDKIKHKYLTFKYNTWIELHPKEAKDLGLSETRLKIEDNE